MSAISTLQQAVLSTFRQCGINHNATKFFVACSGGADSVSLAATLFSLHIPFELAHVNYQLRGEDSDADQLLVERLAKQWSTVVHCLRIPPEKWTTGDSIQAQARAFRYQFFDRLLAPESSDICLLAHHQDDQAETILMGLAKGNSWPILHPMPSARPGYLRPLLEVSKADCCKALQAWNIPWREDLTNQKPTYLRNRIRHHVIPALREVNPSIVQQLLARTQQYQAQQALLGTLLGELVRPGIRITEEVHTFSWAHLPPALTEQHLPTILAFVLTEWGWHGHEVWRGADLAFASPGKSQLFEGKLIKGRDLIQWIRLAPPQKSIEIPSPTSLPFHASFAGRSISLQQCPIPSSFHPPANTHYLDPSALEFPLIIRQQQSGDKMIPLGMTGAKLLSDIMIDEKFRPAQKELGIVIEDQQEIMVLSDFRIADSARLRPNSSVCLKLVIEEAD